MSAPRFVALYQGPEGTDLGRFCDDWLSPGGTTYELWEYRTTGMYALDEHGRPWAYVHDRKVQFATDGKSDPEQLKKWIPL